jgi:hypothetical protein
LLLAADHAMYADKLRRKAVVAVSSNVEDTQYRVV